MDSEISDKTLTVPYIVYDGAQARAERTQRRLIIAVVILSALLFLSNIAWLWTLYGADFESYDYQQDGSGINVIGDENEDIKQYGAESTDKTNNPQERGAGQN